MSTKAKEESALKYLERAKSETAVALDSMIKAIANFDPNCSHNEASEVTGLIESVEEKLNTLKWEMGKAWRANR